jgi:branched-chain amino acid aminotransferase
MRVVWCNGAIVEQLMLDPFERGLNLGDGLFETIAVRHAKAIWCEEHLIRLKTAAAELAIDFDEGLTRAAIKEVLQKSASPIEVLRITLTRGPTARGLSAECVKPSLIVSLQAFDRGALPSSVRLATSTIRRNETSPASRLKTLSYIDPILAAREVRLRADDALMLNTKGHAASATIGNIFLLKGKALITPSSNQAILCGIARGKLIQGAAALGLQIDERAVHAKELYGADCVFVTNSLRLATAVSMLDGKAVGTRDIGFIQDYYEQSSKGERI